MFEIERKFLVKRRFKPRGPSVQIEQAFRDIGPFSLRVRRVDKKHVATIKSRNDGIRRLEFETRVPGCVWKQLRRICGPSIRKTRILHAENGRLWEIDTFRNQELSGLRMAEIELKGGEFLPLPDWVEEEVTSDSRYRNSELSKRIK